jgi:hypothetical protein
MQETKKAIGKAAVDVEDAVDDPLLLPTVELDDQVHLMSHTAKGTNDIRARRRCVFVHRL